MDKLSHGLTLVELLVVVGIIATLSGVFGLAWGTFRQQDVADSGASDMQSFLRSIQNMASSGILCNGVGSASWIFNFAQVTQSVDCQTSTNSLIGAKSFTLTNSAAVDSINVDSNVCTLGAADQSPQLFSAKFRPIFGKIEFAHSTQSCVVSSSYLKIKIINSTDNSNYKYLYLNKDGRIYVQ